MTDHPPSQELEQYRRRTLSPATFLAVHRHIATCPRCANESVPQQLERDFEELRAALLPETDPAPYHLSAAEVAAYSQGELDEIDLEIAESHLVTCTQCRDELQMRAVARANRPSAPAMGPDQVLPVLSRGFQFPFRWLDGWRSWRVATAVCSVAILSLLAMFLFRAKNDERSGPTVGPAIANSQQDSVSTINRAEAVGDQRAPENPPNSAGESHPAPAAGEGALAARQLVVSLKDGEQPITLDNRGELAGLEQLPAHVQQAVKVALQAGRVERPPIIAQLAGRPSTLLSQSDNGLPFQLINPVAQVVESERPTFSWSTLEGAGTYTVTVTDADLNEVAASPPLAATEWRITKSLRPGAIYSWQVTALKDGQAITSPVLPAQQAKFKVVDRETLEMVLQAKRSYHGSHLAAGVLYAEAGLLTKAEQELRALVRANPRDHTAREILRSVVVMNQRHLSRPRALTGRRRSR
jgi:hypothetical protein